MNTSTDIHKIECYIFNALLFYYDERDSKMWLEGAAAMLGWQKQFFRDDGYKEVIDNFLVEHFKTKSIYRQRFLYRLCRTEVKYLKRLLDLLLELKYGDEEVFHKIEYELKLEFPHRNLSREENYHYFCRFVHAYKNILYYPNSIFIVEWLVYLLNEHDGFRAIDSDLWSTLASSKCQLTRKTLLHFVCKRTFRDRYDLPVTDLVRTLLRAGANVDAITHTGKTPLYNAIRYDAPEEVFRLMIEEYGAHLDVSTTNGDSAHSILCQRFHWVPKVLPLKCLSANAIAGLLSSSRFHELKKVIPTQLIPFLRLHRDRNKDEYPSSLFELPPLPEL